MTYMCVKPNDIDCFNWTGPSMAEFKAQHKEETTPTQRPPKSITSLKKGVLPKQNH